MHEMAIATELLESVLSAVAEHGGGQVHEVEVALGAMRQVVPEALETTWQAVTKGTSAEGARLQMTEVPMQARCRSCNHEFAPVVESYLCPRCGQADVEILAGDAIILTSLTCEADDAAEETDGEA